MPLDKMVCYRKPDSHGKSKLDIDFFNHATKADLEEAAIIDRSYLAARLYLASLKAEVDKTDIGKPKTVPDE